MFWHIPWPNAERFGICPWREELHRGHPRLEHRRLPHAAALQQLHRLGRCLHGEPHRSRGARGGAGRPQRRWCGPTRSRSSGRCAGSRMRAGRRPSAARTSGASWGWRRDALLGVGVDRLDYTKGIEERLAAVERAARAHPGVPRPLHLRAAGGAEPHQDRSLPRAERARRSTVAESINDTLGVGTLPADHPAAVAPRAGRRSSATIAPPTSAT